jgi:hypothetical protein
MDKRPTFDDSTPPRFEPPGDNIKTLPLVIAVLFFISGVGLVYKAAVHAANNGATEGIFYLAAACYMFWRAHRFLTGKQRRRKLLVERLDRVGKKRNPPP